MSMRSRRVRHGLAAAVVVLLMTGLRLPMLAQRAPEPGAGGKTGALTANFDIRSSAALRAQLLQRLGRSQPEDGVTKLRRANDALATLRGDLPRATATISPFTGGAELVRNPRGALTPPAPAALGSAAIVSGFLETHAALYGLAAADLATIRFLGESVNRSNGLRMLRAEQAIDGIAVFQSDTRFILDRDGRLIRTAGRLVSRAGAGGTAPAAAIPASAAFASAMQSVGIAVSGTAVSQGPETSRLVYFPLAPGVLVLAYEQMTYTDGPGDYILLANPAASAADVTITYLRTDGTTVARQHVVPPASRRNVHVSDDVPALADASFAAVVEVTNGVGIVVEQSMYWNAGGVVWAAGTNTAAMRLP